MDQYLPRFLAANVKDDDAINESETESLKNTFYINLVVFTILSLLFEYFRHIRHIYQNRLKPQFENVIPKRVPPPPRKYIFGWVVDVLSVSEDDLLKMIGLDAYMFIRFINAAIRISAFISFWNILVLLPAYTLCPDGTRELWSKYTLANVPNRASAGTLWVPAIFAYLFSAYYCYVLKHEYENFLEKRANYLDQGDPDTPIQTQYTVMVENIPTSLRSAASLKEFFEGLFPGQVYCVEFAMDLKELDGICNQRRTVRNNLEKAIAFWKATGRRPTVRVPSHYYDNVEEPLQPLPTGPIATLLGYKNYDAIDHHYRVLGLLNETVKTLQEGYIQAMEKGNSRAGGHVRGLIEGAILEKLKKSTSGELKGQDQAQGQGQGQGQEEKRGSMIPNIFSSSSSASSSSSSNTDNGEPSNSKSEKLLDADALGTMKAADAIQVPSSTDPEGTVISPLSSSNTFFSRKPSNNTGWSIGGPDAATQPTDNVITEANAVKELVKETTVNLAQEGVKTATFAPKVFIKTVLAATRTLELLTVGADKKTSSTAFVTLTSRVARCGAHQMLLTHDHGHTMTIKPAPNPHDIVWENVATPVAQIELRTYTANWLCAMGALWWSVVVSFITLISNLESLSETKGWHWLSKFNKTNAYIIFNDYLALGLLLILLACLPLIFDTITRRYEGKKQESEIQSSIMTRYFYYQLANVYVSVWGGTIITNISDILYSPASILSILGYSLASFSTYFANLIIIKTFTVVPIEALRLWPLILVQTVKMCTDKKKVTRRELRSGAFSDPIMVYGWIYPSVLMVLMIMVTYCCIVPLIMPIITLYFCLAYCNYKYQLLYVYVNTYQAGGFMWYAVFDRSMIVLMVGIFTLLCFMGIRETGLPGPYYLLAPLPIFIYMFWSSVRSRLKSVSQDLPLQNAILIDRANEEMREKGLPDVTSTFNPTLFRQPNLSEGPLKPAVYRKKSAKGLSAGAAVFSDAELGTGSISANIVRKPSLSIQKGSVSADGSADDDFKANGKGGSRSRVGTGGSIEMSEENIVFEDENDEDVGREEEVSEVLNVDNAYESESSSVSFNSLSRDLTNAFRERSKEKR